MARFKRLPPSRRASCVEPLRLRQAPVLPVDFAFSILVAIVQLVSLALHVVLYDIDRLRQLVGFRLCVLQDALDVAALPARGSHWLLL